MSDDKDDKKDLSGSKISKLFDIRAIVGGLLSIYGIILLIKGFLDSDSEIKKAAGLHLNLWTGIGMLVAGLLMLLWMRLRPLEHPKSDESLDESGPRESRAS